MTLSKALAFRVPTRLRRLRAGVRCGPGVRACVPPAGVDAGRVNDRAVERGGHRVLEGQAAEGQAGITVVRYDQPLGLRAMRLNGAAASRVLHAMLPLVQ
jgi:hypothetical protein